MTKVQGWESPEGSGDEIYTNYAGGSDAIILRANSNLRVLGDFYD